MKTMHYYSIGSAMYMILVLLGIFSKLPDKTDIFLISNLGGSIALLCFFIYYMYKKRLWPYIVLPSLTAARLLYAAYYTGELSFFLAFHLALQLVGLVGIILLKKQAGTAMPESVSAAEADDSREARMRRRFEAR